MKLTATYFRYTMANSTGSRQEFDGSYLGRKPASTRTLRNFLQRHSGNRKPRLISVGTSHLTHWNTA